MNEIIEGLKTLAIVSGAIAIISATIYFGATELVKHFTSPYFAP